MKRLSHRVCVLLLGFLLGIHNGNIALWREDDPEPVQVFPYRASNLPPQARKLLEQGIEAEDTAELAKLLESFLS